MRPAMAVLADALMEYDYDIGAMLSHEAQGAELLVEAFGDKGRQLVVVNNALVDEGLSDAKIMGRPNVLKRAVNAVSPRFYDIHYRGQEIRLRYVTKSVALEFGIAGPGGEILLTAYTDAAGGHGNELFLLPFGATVARVCRFVFAPGSLDIEVPALSRESYRERLMRNDTPALIHERGPYRATHYPNARSVWLDITDPVAEEAETVAELWYGGRRSLKNPLTSREKDEAGAYSVALLYSLVGLERPGPAAGVSQAHGPVKARLV